MVVAGTVAVSVEPSRVWIGILLGSVGAIRVSPGVITLFIGETLISEVTNFLGVNAPAINAEINNNIIIVTIVEIIMIILEVSIFIYIIVHIKIFLFTCQINQRSVCDTYPFNFIYYFKAKYGTPTSRMLHIIQI